jgi:transcription-repair coupling factor (superfamily II helicase)
LDIIQLFNKNPFIQQWVQELKEKAPRQLLTGLSGSAKTLTMVSAYKKLKKMTVVITPNLYYANQLVEDLHHVLPPEEIFLFPVDEVMSAEMAFSSPEATCGKSCDVKCACQ